MGEIKLALIGGSGFYRPGMLADTEDKIIETPYGKAAVVIGTLADRKVAFLARHGKGHSLLPHQLNYRANIWALKSLGVKRVLATTAVGSMQPKFPPGSLVIIDQFLDFTKQRPLTFFEDGDVHRAHVDVTHPYCGGLRDELVKAAAKHQIPIHAGGCYVCAEGPRYETLAEIKAYQMLGGDVVGMTGVPEVVLARELGLCYANISIVTNWAAGISPQALSHAEVVEIMAENQEKLRQLITECLASAAVECSVNCCNLS
ncbi:MAG TPA: S-methyl-5'-thioadenosine phosphorylase [Bacillota bacterium]|nr:S-methyl-5'-thioadenosine phosphorylase [Bacillota bacterium]